MLIVESREYVGAGQVGTLYALLYELARDMGTFTCCPILENSCLMENPFFESSYCALCDSWAKVYAGVTSLDRMLFDYELSRCRSASLSSRIVVY